MPVSTLMIWQAFFDDAPFGPDVDGFYLRQLTLQVNRALGGSATMADLKINADPQSLAGAIDTSEVDAEALLPPGGRELLERIENERAETNGGNSQS